MPRGKLFSRLKSLRGPHRGQSTLAAMTNGSSRQGRPPRPRPRMLEVRKPYEICVCLAHCVFFFLFFFSPKAREMPYRGGRLIFLRSFIIYIYIYIYIFCSARNSISRSWCSGLSMLTTYRSTAGSRDIGVYVFNSFFCGNDGVLITTINTSNTI